MRFKATVRVIRITSTDRKLVNIKPIFYANTCVELRILYKHLLLIRFLVIILIILNSLVLSHLVFAVEVRDSFQR